MRLFANTMGSALRQGEVLATPGGTGFASTAKALLILNDEARMSNDESKLESAIARRLRLSPCLWPLTFVILSFRHSFVLRDSDFVICSLTSPGPDCLPEAGLCEIPPADVRRLFAAAPRVSAAPG